MKNIKTILIPIAILAINYATAQTGLHIKLSDDYPSPGEKITMTYDPTGTIIDGKKDVEASVFFLDNKDYPVADIDLKPNGTLLTGEFTVPANAKAFFVKLNSDGDIDNNNDKGYVYLVYKDKQPVDGAYAMKGYFLASLANNYAKITTARKEGIDLYKKEFELHPGIKKDYQKAYYSLIVTEPDYQTDLQEGIKLLEKSDDEKDLVLAVYLLRRSKSPHADSFNSIVKAKFPNGVAVKDEFEDVFYSGTSASKRDSIFNLYAKKYPEVAGDKSTSLEGFRFQLATGYLFEGDLANYRNYEKQLTNKRVLLTALNDMAYEWAEKNVRLEDAEMLAREAMDIATERINNPTAASYISLAQAKKNNQANYYMCADTYAFVLARENKFTEALKYEQPLIDNSKWISTNVYENYLHILAGLGDYAKAKTYAEKAIKDGRNTEAIVNELKIAFVKLNGSESGFDQYLAPLQIIARKKQMEWLANTMINRPAPDFRLKDIEGNTVSLNGLKGKVVVIDFWATWCVPCKNSFPGMQIAVEKYKNDPGVKFLFVDSRETSANYFDDVRKFISANKYSFHVIFDEKDAAGNQKKITNAYDVTGIPTKFIIDKAGNIRFKNIGYSTETKPQELADDISDMITIAANPEAYTPKTEGTK